MSLSCACRGYIVGCQATVHCCCQTVVVVVVVPGTATWTDAVGISRDLQATEMRRNAFLGDQLLGWTTGEKWINIFADIYKSKVYLQPWGELLERFALVLPLGALRLSLHIVGISIGPKLHYSPRLWCICSGQHPGHTIEQPGMMCCRMCEYRCRPLIRFV